MNILLLAPHPFYQERGTLIAEDLLLRALAKRGDRMDVLTYSEGEDRDYGPNVKIHRIRTPRFLRGIRPGFSLKKLLCDAYLAPHAMRLARQNAYDVIHAVEEAAFIARFIGRRLGIPYIFDMDSSMPRQIADKQPLAKPLLPMMRLFERLAIRDAAAVVPVCDALADIARAGGAQRIELLRDISLVPDDAPVCPERGFRHGTGIHGPAVLYIGNLEPYQGIDLLLEGFAKAAPEAPTAALIVVGGRADDIATYRAKAEALGIGAHTHFLGPRPVGDMIHLFRDADILASPRTQGQNTPMKIYSYLDSGKPVLATRLPTHTQVLNDEVAMLVDPTPEAVAAGLTHLLGDAALRSRLAENAKRLAQSTYSRAAFEESVDRLYAPLRKQPPV